jgi:uncharacterized membrane protein YqhA
MPDQPQADQRQEKSRVIIDAAFDAQKMGWLVAVHLVFVISALVLALSDRRGSDHCGE